jgi:hypothetical protein
MIKFTLDKPAATSPLTSLHIIYIGLKSQSSVVLHTPSRQNAARTSSEQKSQPIQRPINHVSSRKPQRYANTLKTSKRGMGRDYIQPGPTPSLPLPTQTPLTQSSKQSINARHPYRLLSLGKAIFASFYDQWLSENPVTTCFYILLLPYIHTHIHTWHFIS